MYSLAITPRAEVAPVEGPGCGLKQIVLNVFAVLLESPRSKDRGAD